MQWLYQIDALDMKVDVAANRFISTRSGILFKDAAIVLGCWYLRSAVSSKMVLIVSETDPCIMIALDSFKNSRVCGKLRGDMWSIARFGTLGYHV